MPVFAKTTLWYRLFGLLLAWIAVQRTKKRLRALAGSGVFNAQTKPQLSDGIDAVPDALRRELEVGVRSRLPKWPHL
jgi:hypothetical protein